MHPQRSCPVCRSEALRRVLRDATFLANLGGEVNPLTGVTSYRCINGHLFMILPASTTKPATQPAEMIPFGRLSVHMSRS
jgi:hypothetical protein